MTSTTDPPATGRAEKRNRADALAAQVAELHEQGLGRNEIARRLTCSPSTVTKAAEIAGVAFDGTATAVATEVAKVDAKSRRAGLVDSLHNLAEKTVVQINTALDNNELEPRALVTLLGVAVDKITKVEPAHDYNAESMEQSKQALSELHQAIVSSVRYVDTDGNPMPDDYAPEPRFRSNNEYY